MMVSNTITINGYWKIKRPRFCPWPHPTNPKREILVTPRDILMRCSDSSFQSVNGLVCSGLRIPRDDVEYHHDQLVIVMSGEML